MMEMSEKTAELFTALSKFQGDLTNSYKSKSGHGYNYSDLATVIDTAKQPLLDNGLAVVQLIGKTEDGSTTLTTMLTHSSGEWMRDEYILPPAVLQGGASKNPAQVLGSAITYSRRYAYASIIGMAQSDDDAAQVRDTSTNKAPQNQLEPKHQQWVDAARANRSVLDQIDTPEYRKFIESHL